MDYSKLSDNTLEKLSKGEPLDYSKLTDEELLELKNLPVETDDDDFTLVDDKVPNSNIDTSMPEAFVRGAARGASFDFIDEITGALAAAPTAIKSGSSWEDFVKEYEKQRDEARAEYDLAQQEYPVTSFIGGLTGGFAVPGFGALKAGSKMSNLAESLLLAKSLPAGKVGKTVLGAGAELAAGGALAGVGGSTAETGKELASDALTGAEYGLALGGAVSGSLAGLGKVLSTAKKTKLAKDFAEKFSIAKQHGSQLGKIDEATEELRKTTEELLSNIKSTYDENIEDYNKLYAILDKEAKPEQTVSGIIKELKKQQERAPSQFDEIQSVIDILASVGEKQTKTVRKLVPKKEQASRLDKPDTAALQMQVAAQTKRTQFLQEIDFLTRTLDEVDENGVPVVNSEKAREAIVDKIEERMHLVDKIEQDPAYIPDENMRGGYSTLFESPESFTGRLQPITGKTSTGTEEITGYVIPEIRMAVKGKQAQRPKYRPEKLVEDEVTEETFLNDLLKPSVAGKARSELGHLLKNPNLSYSSKELIKQTRDDLNKLRKVETNQPVSDALTKADMTRRAIADTEILLKNIDTSALAAGDATEIKKLGQLYIFARQLGSDSAAGLKAHEGLAFLEPKLKQVLGEKQANELINKLKVNALKYKSAMELGAEAAFGSLNPSTLGMPERTAGLTAAAELGDLVGKTQHQILNRYQQLKKAVKIPDVKPPHEEAATALKMIESFTPEQQQELIATLNLKDKKVAGLVSRVLTQQGGARRAGLWALMQQPAVREALFGPKKQDELDFSDEPLTIEGEDE